jgi:hypothetical protein
MKDFHSAAIVADSLIAAELGRQDAMWGVANERADSQNGELFDAAHAQLWLAMAKREGSDSESAIKSAAYLYPLGWTGFRDYGSDVANIVVAIAYLRQEVKRLIANGADTTRLSRQASQPYTGDQPAVILPYTGDQPAVILP